MNDEEAADIYRDALEKIAAGKRPDGTYNRSREACGQVARDALELVRQRTSSDPVPAHDEDSSPLGSLASDKAEIRKLCARVEVELDLRRAAYERIAVLEEELRRR